MNQCDAGMRTTAPETWSYRCMLRENHKGDHQFHVADEDLLKKDRSKNDTN